MYVRFACPQEPILALHTSSILPRLRELVARLEAHGGDAELGSPFPVPARVQLPPALALRQRGTGQGTGLLTSRAPVRLCSRGSA